MSGWRPALRIARRSVRRDLKRSLLIAALIALPIAGATVVDGLLRTLTGTEHSLARYLGEADGAATITSRTTMGEGWQPGLPPPGPTDESTERDPATVDLLGMLPPGSRIVRAPTLVGLRLRVDDRIVRTALNTFPIGDPLTRQFARLVSGRLPDTPTEALLTRPLAERLGVLDGDEIRPGTTITADEGPTVTVTGVAIHPYTLSQRAVLALPGSALLEAKTIHQPEPWHQYFVDLPAGTNPDDVWPVLAEFGVDFQPRSMFTDPGRYPTYISDDPLETVGPVGLVVGFGLLEVVLLAGAAFAVGARRRVRELGLVSANGGTSAHLRRIVLAQGLCLGVVGSLAGLGVGMVALTAGAPLWERLTDTLVEQWRFGWVELTVTVAVGVLSGLAAALLPAFGVARMRPVDALAQRFRHTASRARLPVLGIVLVGVGILGVLASGLVARQLRADYRTALESTLTFAESYPTLDLTLPIGGVLAGGLAIVVGMIMLSPGLVSVLGRIGSRLPLSSRLALRDAGRHRHRTVPAVMAIMIVVTGSVALAFVAATAGTTSSRYVPENTVMVTADPALPTPPDLGSLRDGVAAVAAELPDARTIEVTTIVDPTAAPEGGSQAMLDTTGANMGCNAYWTGFGVGTPELIELVTGRRPSADALTAMAEGKVLVTDDCVVDDGTVTTYPPTEAMTLPAHHVPSTDQNYYSDLPGVFMSAEAARARGMTTEVTAFAVIHADTATDDEIDSALTVAENGGLIANHQPDESAEAELIALALAGGAGLVTLLGVGITVALSAAEGRADLATLVAIGAQPRRRRMLAGAQALVLSVLGTLFGLLFGGVLAFAVVPMTASLDLVLPWESLAVTAVGVPLLAAVVAMLTTRSTLPVGRRVQ